MRTFLAYYKYSLKNLTHKLSIWIVFGIYQFYFILALFILPLMRHSSPFEIWNFSFQNLFASFDMAINIHVLTFILCSIFTVFLVILIFKNDLFDGGRLLVSTKPISKTQIMLCKLLVYFSAMIFTIFISLIIVATVLFLPSARTDISLYDSLFISILVDGLLLFFVFGGVAILLVSFVNQIGLMICMIGGAVGFAVFDIVAPSITFSNSELIMRRTGAEVDTYKFVDYNGTMQAVASLNNPDLDLKNEWDATNTFSTRKLINYLDITNQLVTPLNMAKWETMLNDQTARGELGANPLYTYQINNRDTLQEWYNNSANVVLSMIPMHLGISYSMQNQFGAIGFSYNTSSYDELTSAMGIEPIGYYVSSNGPMHFVYFNDLTNFANPANAITAIRSLVTSLANSHTHYFDALISSMLANKTYYGVENEDDYYNLTSMKIFFNATRIIEEKFWANAAQGGLMDSIFFESEGATWNDLSASLLNNFYLTGTWIFHGRTITAPYNLWQEYKIYSDLYRDIFFDINTWTGWTGTTPNSSLIISIPTVNFGSLDVIKHTYNFNSYRTMTIPSIMGFWFGLSTVVMIISIAITIRKDVY